MPIVLYVDASWEVGGLVGYVVGLAHGMRRRGYQVAAVCHQAEAVAPMRDLLRYIGVDVHQLEDGDPSLPGRLRRLRAFASAVRQYEGCVLALMMGYCLGGGTITLAGRLAGAGAVVRADLQPPVPPIARRHCLDVQLKDRLVDRIVVGAAENREAFARQMGRSAQKIDVVHTGIELQRLQPGRGRTRVREDLGYSPETCVVGTVSRLSEERKGLSFFLEMAAQVARAFPSAAFLVVGDGLLRSQLERRASELGIANQVTFTGWRSDIPELLAGMDVFVMPSLFEGGPTSVLEAMAMGKAVVSSGVGMVPEVIDDGRTGFIVPPGDSRALAEAVTTLLVDEPLRTRFGEQAREAAEREFSMDIMVERYLQTFAKALGPAHASRSPR